MAAALLFNALALPRGNVVVESSGQPLASGPPPMDGATHGDMPAPDYSHIPEEMLPTPGEEKTPLADIMAWHSQRTLQGMAAPHEAAREMHGPSAQEVAPAQAGQAMTAAPAGEMHDMPAPDFAAIPAGTPPPTRTARAREPKPSPRHTPAHITNRGPNPQQACCRHGCASRRAAEPMLARTRKGACLLWYERSSARGGSTPRRFASSLAHRGSEGW